MAAAYEPELPQRVRFQDPDHGWWSVHEVSDPTSPAGKSLLFVSDEGFRRVRTYPSDWQSLTPEALWTLSWGR